MKRYLALFGTILILSAMTLLLGCSDGGSNGSGAGPGKNTPAPLSREAQMATSQLWCNAEDGVGLQSIKLGEDRRVLFRTLVSTTDLGVNNDAKWQNEGDTFTLEGGILENLRLRLISPTKLEVQTTTAGLTVSKTFGPCGVFQLQSLGETKEPEAQVRALLGGKNWCSLPHGDNPGLRDESILFYFDGASNNMMTKLHYWEDSWKVSTHFGQWKPKLPPDKTKQNFEIAMGTDEGGKGPYQPEVYLPDPSHDVPTVLYLAVNPGFTDFVPIRFVECTPQQLEEFKRSNSLLSTSRALTKATPLL